MAKDRSGAEASKRKKIPADERFDLWVRSGGRCAICGTYLLEGAITYEEMNLGEMAHIVGQKDSDGSPRGRSTLPAKDRDKAPNLMLICASHHDEIDRDKAAGIMNVERLTAMKTEHESFIRRVTGLQRDRRTTILRMLGDVRGDAVELGTRTAVEAVIDGGLYPKFLLSLDELGIEIDLRHIAGEAQPTADYWKAAISQIDQVIEHKVREGIRAGAITHLSVFGFARLPLLTYLGAALDDTCPVSTFQRHRTGDSWVWPKGEGEAAFELTLPESPSAEDAVLVLNISGTIEPSAVPVFLNAAPVFTIAATNGAPATETIRTKADLDRFSQVVRDVFAELERAGKVVKHLHVLAAAPVSAAIALGRALDPHVHPALVMYDRMDDGAYKMALTIE